MDHDVDNFRPARPLWTGPVPTLTKQWGVKEVLDVLAAAEEEGHWLTAEYILNQESDDLDAAATQEEQLHIDQLRSRIRVALADLLITTLADPMHL